MEDSNYLAEDYIRTDCHYQKSPRSEGENIDNLRMIFLNPNL